MLEEDAGDRVEATNAVSNVVIGDAGFSSKGQVDNGDAKASGLATID